MWLWVVFKYILFFNILSFLIIFNHQPDTDPLERETREMREMRETHISSFNIM